MNLAFVDSFLAEFFLPQQETPEEEVKALFTLSSGYSMLLGQTLAAQKEKLGRKFNKWLDELGVSRTDAKKYINLWQLFGDISSELLEAGTLPLFRLSAPNLFQARDQLRQRLEEDNTPVTQQEIDEIRLANKPAPSIGAKAQLVGNQKGGTPIFRIEVKGGVLATECEKSLQNSGESCDSWMAQLLSSFGLVGDIAQAVLGKGISHLSDVDKLRATLESQNFFNLNELELIISPSEENYFKDFGAELPKQVQDCVVELLRLSEQIAAHHSPVGAEGLEQRVRIKQRRSIEEQLRLLCNEFDLDYQTLIFNLKKNHQVGNRQ